MNPQVKTVTQVEKVVHTLPQSSSWHPDLSSKPNWREKMNVFENWLTNDDENIA